MRILTLAVLTVFSATGAEKLMVYESDHFELITDGSKGRAQEILGQFERVRSFFMRVMTLQDPLMKPRIVVFGSDKEFREYSPNEVAAAYYLASPNRDMIAIGGTQREDDQRKAVHEYLHMLNRQTELNLPLWMNEGIAELYSTIQPTGKKIQVGAAIGNHILLLRNEWLDLAQVIDVDHGSPIYNRRAHAGAFYAMSWALTHMLSLGADYKAGYSKVTAGIAAGKSTAELLPEVYGKSIKQIESDLRAYIQSNSVMTLVFDLQFDKTYDKIPPREASAYEWAIARADLLAGTGKHELAKSRLEALTQQEANRPEAWESLAFLHWMARQENHQKLSAEALMKAQGLKSTNPNLAYWSPALTRDVALSGTLLRGLVERHPNYVEGRIRLAEQLLYEGAYSKSYDELKQVKRISPRQAPRYFPVLIQTTWRLQKLEECRVGASQFKQVAKTPAEKESAAKWFAYAMKDPPPPRAPRAAESTEQLAEVRRAEEADPGNPFAPPPLPPPEEFLPDGTGVDVVREGNELRIVRNKLTQLEGVLVNLECKNPQAILTVKNEAGTTRILIEDPTNINLKMGEETKMELTCGPQSTKVKVGYFPRENALEKTVGALSTLEFVK